MHIKNQKQEGFVLVLTLLILSLIVVIVSQFSGRGSMHAYFNSTMINREQAKTLAWNGVQLAMAQLHMERQSKKESNKQPDAKKEPEPQVAFLERVLPILNKLQTFPLKENIDGIDGTIKLCITSEDGKIDLSQLYDIEKHTFIEAKKGEQTTRKLFEYVFATIKKTTQQDLFTSFETYLKERNIELNDVTQLLEQPLFNATFKQYLWYDPLVLEQKKDKKKSPFFLTDLFTVWSDAPTLQPWLLSPSLKTILGIKELPKPLTKEAIKELVKDAKLQEASVEKLWNSKLKKLYGKEFKTLPKELSKLWAAKFEPSTFSVVSYGVVGQITQKLLVIIKRTTSYESIVDEFEIIKLYWL